MRDKQTKRTSAGRLQQAKVTWHAKGCSSWSWVARHYRCNSLKTDQQNINNFLQHLWHYFTMMNWIEEPKRMQSYMCWLSQERCQGEAEDSWIKLVQWYSAQDWLLWKRVHERELHMYTLAPVIKQSKKTIKTTSVKRPECTIINEQCITNQWINHNTPNKTNYRL